VGIIVYFINIIPAQMHYSYHLFNYHHATIV